MCCGIFEKAWNTPKLLESKEKISNQIFEPHILNFPFFTENLPTRRQKYGLPVKDTIKDQKLQKVLLELTNLHEVEKVETQSLLKSYQLQNKVHKAALKLNIYPKHFKESYCS